jgi:hypothetical protein
MSLPRYGGKNTKLTKNLVNNLENRETKSGDRRAGDECA